MIRFFDLLISLLGLILLIPIFLIIALAIFFESKGNVIFAQERIGLNGSKFNLFKFRTMTLSDSPSLLLTVHNDPRITKVGKFLRKHKLDELPQLYNVLKGEMSIVGPRPEVPEYVKYYNEEQRKILMVKPGITDYASIRFSNENELLADAEDPRQFYIDQLMPKKIELNTIFLNNRSLGNYFNVIFKTLMQLLK